MLSEVEVIQRPAQPYVAIGAQVTMQTIATILPELHPRVFAWLGERGIPPVGPPFWKYNVIDMDRGMEVEVGVPVDVVMDGDTRTAQMGGERGCGDVFSHAGGNPLVVLWTCKIVGLARYPR